MQILKLDSIGYAPEFYFIYKIDGDLYKIDCLDSFGYVIIMNRNFEIIYLESSYVSDDESPLEICQCVNSLIFYIKQDLIYSGNSKL